MVPGGASECPDCGAPVAAPTGEPAKGASAETAKSAATPPAAVKKSAWRVSLGDLAREASAKETSLGRKLWLWFCVVFIIVFALAKITKLA